MLIGGTWNESPIIAIGNITNIRPYGEQTVDQLPWPMSPDVHKLDWCEGTFRAVSVLKGKLPQAPRKYLWASVSPGCTLWDDDPDLVFHRFKTRAWFLREEGDFLRPTFDGGTPRYLGLFAKWDDDSHLAPREHLGTLLLEPSANSDSLESYAKYLWDVGDIACDLLGKAQCVREIRTLTTLGNAVLRKSACNYLEWQLLVERCP